METWKEHYAELIVRRGVALRPGESLLVHALTEHAAFAERLAETAYRQGASQAVVRFESEVVERQRLLYAPERSLSGIPGYWTEHTMYHLRRGACYVNLVGGDPCAMEAVPSHRLRLHREAVDRAEEELRGYLGGSHTRWCVAALPGRAWAQRVFPRDPHPVRRLWRCIVQCARADSPDPCAAWDRHVAGLRKQAARLNGLGLGELRFTTGLGTDLTVGLADGARWCGGVERSAGGRLFSPNIPTEEVWTVPHRKKAQGRVVASMPLCHQGVVIRGLQLSLQSGRVTDWRCETGAAEMEALLRTPGMDRLGEVALVAAGNPVQQAGVLFYNTLFDENAACHLALGNGSTAALSRRGAGPAAQGLNTAGQHVDFVFGTDDLRCTGRTRKGEELPVMERGTFVDWPTA